MSIAEPGSGGGRRSIQSKSRQLKSQRARSAAVLTFRLFRLSTVDSQSLEPVTKPHFQAEHAVLVALAEKRHLVREVVLHLDHTLDYAGGVGRVGDREVARHLLLKGDARACPDAGTVNIGVNLDLTDAEESAQSARYLACKRLLKQ